MADDDDVDMTPAPDTAWSAGNFAFFFFYMGQGNCCLTVCPDQTLVLIDCGSLRGFNKEMIPVIRDRILMYAPDKVIEYMILTHPDRDHYNQLINVLGGFTIDTLIVSAAITDSPLQRYNKSFVSQKIYNKSVTVNTIKEVTLRADATGVRTWTGDFDTPVSGPINTASTYQVCPAPAPGQAWNVQIVASNVGYNESQGLADAKAINGASVVTVFTLGAQKIINPGDANLITETFMMTAARQPLIQNVTLALVSHHGSDDQCNTQGYVNLLNPVHAVVSVEQMEKSFFVPKNTAMNYYLAVPALSDGEPSHAVDTWVLAPGFVPGYDNEAYDIKESWINDGDSFVTRGRFYTLKNIPAEGGNYSLCPVKGFMLNRTYITKSIYSTGTSYATGLPMLYYSFTP